MKKKDPNWLTGCAVCNVGLVSRMDEIINSGQAQSIASAARILEAEAFDTNGGVLAISRNAIESRYRTLKGLASCWDQKKANSCIENQLRRALSHLRTAANKLEILNTAFQQQDIHSIDGIEILLGKVDLVRFAKEFVQFTQYLSKEGFYCDLNKEDIAPHEIEGS